jgi:hypothetical protein
MSPPTGHRRAKSIETELEQLLSMNENCNDDDNEEEDDDRGLDSKSNSTGNSSKSKERRRRKIKYNRDDDPQHNENIDSKSVKSNKSKSSSARSHRSLGTHTTTSPRSRRSRNKESHHNSSSIPGLNNNDSTNSFVEEDDSNNKSNSRSPLVRTKNGSTRSRDSRKIRYNNNETTTMSIEERDRDEKSVSARSRKSYDSKDHSSNKSPNNNSNSRSTTTTTTTTEEERSSKNRGSRRNIKYQKDEVVPESAQERDKDTRSTRSGGSGSRDNARSSRRRIHDGNNNKKKVVTGTTLFGESSSSSPHDRMSSRRRKVVKKPLDRKNDLLDEFEDWSSGDEAEEFPIKDNDNDDDNDDDDNDNDAATRPRELRRGINRSQSTMDRPRRQQRTRRGGLMRSMSQDVTLTQSTRLDENEYDNDKYDDDESHGIELNCNNNNSRGTTMRSEIPPRRVPRSASIKNASVGMVLGDPSRRAPPSRCKSGISPRESALSSSRAAMGPPSRSQSNDFSLFLRQGTKLQQQQRPSMRISSVQQGVDNLKFGVEDDDDDDNPFEVINKGPYESKSSRNMINDMFDDPNNNNNDEDVHSSSARDINRRGNLIASKSGGLLQLKASSKDTMRVSARTKKIVVMTGDEEKQSIQDAKIERDKQRRAEYNRSIAAAASAGTIRMPRRASHRQVKRQNSSDLGDSISKLEATLESGQNELWN